MIIGQLQVSKILFFPNKNKWAGHPFGTPPILIMEIQSIT